MRAQQWWEHFTCPSMMKIFMQSSWPGQQCSAHRWKRIRCIRWLSLASLHAVSNVSVWGMCVISVGCRNKGMKRWRALTGAEEVAGVENLLNGPPVPAAGGGTSGGVWT